MLVKQRIRKSIGVALVAAVAFTAVFSSQSFAQSATTNSTNVIKISPVRTDVSIESGKSKSVPITISNLTKNDISVSSIENDFSSADENGTPALILDSTKFAPTHSLKRFLVPITNTVIPAGKAVTINVLITVPVETQAGGYFGAIRFTPTSTDDSGQVNLSPNVASLILLTVPGPATEQLNLTDFNIQQNGKIGNFFNDNKNLTTFIRFENKGNLQEAPFGVITVKNGSKVVSTTNFNTTDPRDEILPDGARRWTEPLTGIGAFGHYTVTATLAYGKNNVTVEAIKSFWVIPQWMIYAAIAAVIIIIALIIFLVIFIRGRGRRAARNQLSGRYRR